MPNTGAGPRRVLREHCLFSPSPAAPPAGLLLRYLWALGWESRSWAPRVSGGGEESGNGLILRKRRLLAEKNKPTTITLNWLLTSKSIRQNPQADQEHVGFISLTGGKGWGPGARFNPKQTVLLPKTPWELLGKCPACWLCSQRPG